MKSNLIIIVLVLWGFIPEAKTTSLDGSAIMIRVDSLGEPNIIRSQKNGELVLGADRGKGVGPTIEYMSEWEAFGFFREGNHIEWNIRVDKSKRYTVYLEWSAEGGVVGNPYVLSIGKRSLKGKNKDSGSWETFIEEPIGHLKIKKGAHKVVFRPGDHIEEGGGMLDVKTIRLVPVR